MRALVPAGVVLLLLVRVEPAGQRAPASTITVDQLITQVVGVRHPAAFRFHSTLTRSIKGSQAKDVRQLVGTGLRSPSSTTMLYRQAWPVVPGGRAVVIVTSADRGLRGFLYDGGRVTTLTDTLQGTRFFDSDLLLEDIAETFWFWTSRTRAGDEPVGAHNCVVVNLRPPPGYAGTYSAIKTWLSPDLAIALRLDQFTRDGRFAKRISLYRELRLNDRWVPAIVTAEPADGLTRTVIEGTKYEPLARLSAADFTVAAVRRAIRGGR
jgi:Outer membrane lipoprotein-sorting protein